MRMNLQSVLPVAIPGISEYLFSKRHAKHLLRVLICKTTCLKYHPAVIDLQNQKHLLYLFYLLISLRKIIFIEHIYYQIYWELCPKLSIPQWTSWTWCLPSKYLHNSWEVQWIVFTILLIRNNVEEVIRSYGSTDAQSSFYIIKLRGNIIWRKLTKWPKQMK